MQTRACVALAVAFNTTLLTYFAHKQFSITKRLTETSTYLEIVENELRLVANQIENVTLIHRRMKDKTNDQFHQLKQLLEASRQNYIRIKRINEKPEENLDAKIVEMASFLGVSMTSNDIERANRIGVKKKRNGRIIVAQLSNHKLKLKLIREASSRAGKIDFSIQDDATYFVASIPKFTDSNSTNKKGCDYIQSVGPPLLHSKSATVYGAWMKDPAQSPDGPIWVLRQFYENRVVEEYKNMRDVVRWRPRVTFELPYEWAGTGHVISKSSLYFNKFNSSSLVKYNLHERIVDIERDLVGAAFGNQAPYQWSGLTDIDFAVDELGLWVIYATMENALDFVISKLDADTLEVLNTWSTNQRKQWSGNAFMACGILYVLKKYDEAETILSYMYDTKDRTHKNIQVRFENPYQWNTMLSYNPVEKKLYSWDRGYLITYNVTFKP